MWPKRIYEYTNTRMKSQWNKNANELRNDYHLISIRNNREARVETREWAECRSPRRSERWEWQQFGFAPTWSLEWPNKRCVLDWLKCGVDAEGVASGADAASTAAEQMEHIAAAPCAQSPPTPTYEYTEDRCWRIRVMTSKKKWTGNCESMSSSKHIHE